jgi:16S rRNA (guanine1516-N2)-methyltransferase
VGIKPGRLPTVADATAGLGRDAFVLASLGCEVTLIERHPAVHAALAAALDRARLDDAPADVAAAAARMRLLAGDARVLLPGLGAQVVLVDPMHPDRGNTALVKQPMRALRAVVGADADVAALMAVALAAARRRVVLKWPRLASPVPGLRAPSHVIAGRTTRYDVFVVG